MLEVTRAELDALTVGTAATMVALVVVSAGCAWWQDQQMRALRDQLAVLEGDVDTLWAWCRSAAAALGWDDNPGGGDGGGDDDGPDDDGGGPGTVVAHPADTWARKTALLGRYAHHGQHRT